MHKIGLMMVLGLSLSGCVHPGGAPAPDKTLKTGAPGTPAAWVSGLDQCQAELTSLRAFDVTTYTYQKTALDHSLSIVSQYLLLRPTLRPDMQQVMDSVYQARLVRRCQDIHTALFALMLKRADSPS
ncbi:TPA: hypothetical protein ACQ39K_004734 [Yersinia enterocolitica]